MLMLYILCNPNRVNILKVWGELPAKYSLMVESTVDFSISQAEQTVYEKCVEMPKSLANVLSKIFSPYPLMDSSIF